MHILYVSMAVPHQVQKPFNFNQWAASISLQEFIPVYLYSHKLKSIHPHVNLLYNLFNGELSISSRNPRKHEVSIQTPTDLVVKPLTMRPKC